MFCKEFRNPRGQRRIGGFMHLLGGLGVGGAN